VAQRALVARQGVIGQHGAAGQQREIAEQTSSTAPNSDADFYRGKL
jgi:hypothetical protein